MLRRKKLKKHELLKNPQGSFMQSEMINKLQMIREFNFIIFLLVTSSLSSVLASDCTENCQEPHKAILPVTLLEGFGFIFFFIVTIITTVGGIGGGAFYLPIFMVFFSFTLKEAIPLSLTCVMGILFARFLSTIREKHPRRDKPLINYEICLIFSPCITVGTVFGVLLNKIAPSWLIMLLVLIVLGTLGYKTYKKARVLKQAETFMKGRKVFNLTEHEKTYLFNIYAKIRDLNEDNVGQYDLETRKSRVLHSQYVKQMSMTYVQRKASAQDFNDFRGNKLTEKLIKEKLLDKDDTEKEDEAFLKNIQDKIKEIEHFEKIYQSKPPRRPSQEELEMIPKSISESMDDDVIPPQHIDTARKSVLQRVASKLHAILERERHLIPFDKLRLMLLMLGILVVISLVQGSRHFPSIIGIPFCSTGYWFIRFSFLPIGVFFLLYVIRYLALEHQEKQESGYIFLKNDLNYDFTTSLQITQNGIFTGFASSILGIGGAIFIGPLLLHLGLPPQEATYTASFSALFTSITAVIQYLLTGLIQWDYAFVLTLIGICGMLVAVRFILKRVNQMGNSSIIVEVLALVIILSTVLIIVSGMSFMYIDYEAGIDIWSFRSLC